MSSTTPNSHESESDSLWHQRIKSYHWKISIFILFNDVPNPQSPQASIIHRLDEELGFKIKDENLSQLEYCLESETNSHRFLLALQPEWFHLDESTRARFLSKWKAPDNHRCCHEICAACGSADAYKSMCPNCDQCYCNEKCQKSDWFSHRHTCATKMAAVTNFRAFQHSNQMDSELSKQEDSLFANLDRGCASSLVLIAFDYLRREGISWREIVSSDDLQYPEGIERSVLCDSFLVHVTLTVIHSAPDDPLKVKELNEFRDCVWISLLVIAFAYRKSKLEILLERSITTVLEDYIRSTSIYKSLLPANDPLAHGSTAVLGLLLWLCRAGHTKAILSLIRVTPEIGLNRFSMAYSFKMLASCPSLIEPDDAFFMALKFLQTVGSNIWDIELIFWLTRFAAKQDHVRAHVLLASLHCLSDKTAPLYGRDIKEADKLLKKVFDLDTFCDEAQWVATVQSLTFASGERYAKASRSSEDTQAAVFSPPSGYSWRCTHSLALI